MLHTLWGSLRALFSFLTLAGSPADLFSGDPDLGHAIDPNG